MAEGCSAGIEAGGAKAEVAVAGIEAAVVRVEGVIVRFRLAVVGGGAAAAGGEAAGAVAEVPDGRGEGMDEGSGQDGRATVGLACGGGSGQDDRATRDWESGNGGWHDEVSSTDLITVSLLERRDVKGAVLGLRWGERRLRSEDRAFGSHDLSVDEQADAISCRRLDIFKTASKHGRPLCLTAGHPPHSRGCLLISPPKCCLIDHMIRTAS